MRYNLESTLPLNAFSPRGGAGPFSYGMTLEGGGGGGGFVGDIVSGIGDAFSSVGDAFSGAIEGISDLGVEIDKGVNDVVPGGWGTVAAVAVPFLAPEAMMAAMAAELGSAGAAAALSAGTSATTSAIKGKSLEDTLKGAALSGALSYGIGSLGDGAGGETANMNDAGAGSSGYGEANDLPTDLPSSPDPFVPEAPVPEALVPEAPVPESSSELFNDGYNPNANPDVMKVPGIAGLEIQPPNNSYLGALPTGTSDAPVGYRFDGPNGEEIVAPNGKTYLIKDIEAGLNSTSITPPADVQQGLSSLTSNPTKPVVTGTDIPKEAVIPNVNDAGAGSTGYGETNDLPTENPVAKDPFSNPTPKDSIFDKIIGAPGRAYDYLSNTNVSDMPKDLYNAVADHISETGYPQLALEGLGIAGLAGIGPLGGIGQKLGTASLLGGNSGKDKAGSPTKNPTAEAQKEYKYGSAGNIGNNYMLRNRINAGNVYSNATGYRPVTRMADGGEVRHFNGGGISDMLTNVFQPVEKAVVQPIGQAAPFLKDALPYAGMIAAPFIASPMAAAGVGALASGMGQGGFNMKRALMGGISAYGMSNIGAGVEAAGNMTPLAETEGVSKSLNANNFFRDPEMMKQGAENLMAGGNSYDLAAKNFATKAGLPSAAMAIMGQSGVSAVNEGIAQKAASDQAFAQAQAAQAATDAKNTSIRERSMAAVRAHPYMYAMGGMIPNPPDDQTGMPNQTPMQNFEHGGALGYAMGGYAMGGEPKFLSGGGDGMSDSIHANIDGNQEARLADGEFVIPADVVSHLGNGSSKAGAKQLYSMMDRVRQARTGNKKQGKQINPRKLMTA